MKPIFLSQSSGNSFLFFLWLLIAFVVGWLVSRWYYKSKYKKEVERWKTNYKNLEHQQNTTVKAKKVTAPGITPIPTQFVDGVARVDDSVKDELTKVEGIGPKIKALLNDDGIWSFLQLAQASVDRLQGILDNAGPRYRMHNPSTWPRQALLAAEGKWEELKKWQSELKGGR
ncbi:MAG: hypothetical protein QNJ57_04665 [Flavobacteriaceae bacterium]|nr:hypothetical protein [Flavobacteriaceae bacterium]